MKYAYLVASLPALVMDEPPPVSAEDFLFHAQGALDADDWVELDHALAGRSEACVSDAARRWFDFDTQMRNAAAEVRAKRHGVDPRGFTNSHDLFHGEADQSVIDAFARTNPRERELVLDQARWRFLNELAGRDPYGFAAVLAHALQLRLVERWSGFDPQRGAETLESNLHRILETTATETL